MSFFDGPQCVRFEKLSVIFRAMIQKNILTYNLSRMDTYEILDNKCYFSRAI